MSNKLYKKINGVWTKTKSLFKNNNGTWSKTKKEYKKINGVWTVIYSGAIEYTFTSSITASSGSGIPLTSYVNPNDADEFIITINSGVILRGAQGGAGGNGAGGSMGTKRSNCHNTDYGNGGNGGTGGSGGHGLNFSGFSSKKVTIINNGSVIGGRGGTGGHGGNGAAVDISCGGSFGGSYYTVTDSTTGGCGGAGGAGGSWANNTTGVNLAYGGTNSTHFTSGATGSAGSGGSGSYNSIRCDCMSCFLPTAKVLMADGTEKEIQYVLPNEYVIDMYGKAQKVIALDRPKQGNRSLYRINDLITTDDHPIVNSTRDGFCAVDITNCKEEANKVYPLINADGEVFDFYYEFINIDKTPLTKIEKGSSIATVDGKEDVHTLEVTDIQQGQLYSLYVDGSHTFSVDGYFVGGFATDIDFDYSKGEER